MAPRKNKEKTWDSVNADWVTATRLQLEKMIDALFAPVGSGDERFCDACSKLNDWIETQAALYNVTMNQMWQLAAPAVWPFLTWAVGSTPAGWNPSSHTMYVCGRPMQAPREGKHV